LVFRGLQLLIAPLFAVWAIAAAHAQPSPEAQAANEREHRRMLQVLGIGELRPGANGSDLTAPNAVNYDEAKVGTYSLPDPLRLESGEPVRTAEMWRRERRAELFELFDREVYGRVPSELPPVRWTVVKTSREERGGVGMMTRRLAGRVEHPTQPALSVTLDLLVATPAGADGPVPMVLELGFIEAPAWLQSRIPAGPDWRDLVAAKGWGYAIIVPSSIQADNGGELQRGIIGLSNDGRPRGAEDWGVLRAWAWGASRALDHLESDPTVDGRRVAVEGLSRYGKAALVAMAYDPRFAVAFVGSSGAGGAKLLRRDFGERVENLAGSGEHHWFAGNFLKYAGPLSAHDLPVDAHSLVALCAPRPVFISAGDFQGDSWVDPKGMYEAAVAAGPVYRLLGRRAPPPASFPPLGVLVDGDLAYRQHEGGHTNGPNWPTFLTFAQRYLEPANQ
jgi:hypothetical protein